MHIYTLLREFADSWVLLCLCLFFVGVLAWAFRPGSRALHAEVSQIPFRNDDRPARAARPRGEETGQ